MRGILAPAMGCGSCPMWYAKNAYHRLISYHRSGVDQGRHLDLTVRIITIEREFGCGGAKIAKLLAHPMGWKLWDQLLTTEIARLAKCDRCEVEQREERMDPLYYRLLKSVLLGSF